MIIWKGPERPRRTRNDIYNGLSVQFEYKVLELRWPVYFAHHIVIHSVDDIERAGLFIGFQNPLLRYINYRWQVEEPPDPAAKAAWIAEEKRQADAFRDAFKAHLADPSKPAPNPKDYGYANHSWEEDED